MAKGAPCVRFMFVDNKTKATYKTCRRTPIWHGSFILDFPSNNYHETRTKKKLGRHKVSQ